MRKITVATLAITCAVYTGISILGAAATMQIPRLPLIYPQVSAGLDYEDVGFPSRGDKILLKGWYFSAYGDAALVIIHGGFQNRVDPLVRTLELTRDLLNRGYNILLFDLRGRGESGGKGLSLTDLDLDIGGAYDFLKARGFQADDIGMVGFCSGAAGACFFASHEQIGGLVLNGCFTKVEAMFYNQAAARHIPRVLVSLFLPGVHLAAKVFYGYEIVNPIDVIGKIQCPLFFIHEENDVLNSTADNIRLKNASINTESELWEVPGTEHSWAYQDQPQEYVAKVDAFFKKTLSDRQMAP